MLNIQVDDDWPVEEGTQIKRSVYEMEESKSIPHFSGTKEEQFIILSWAT